MRRARRSTPQRTKADNGGNAVGGMRRIWALVPILVGAYLVFRHFAVADIHYQWLRHLGAAVLFWTPVRAEALTGLCGGIVFAAATYANLRLCLADSAGALGASLGTTEGWGAIGAPALTQRGLRRLAGAVALAVGLVAGWAFSGQWPTIAYFWHATPFSRRDPLFSLNVGFFVFTLPFLRLLYSSAGLLLWLAGLAAGVVYWMSGRVTALGGRLAVHPQARRHLAAILGLYLLLKAVGYRMDAWNLDYSTRGFTFGAGWVDVHVALPVLWLLSGLAVAAAAAAVATALNGQMRWLLTGIGALAGTSVILGSLLPGIVESVVVKPSQYSLERPYILRNIAMTRAAFGLGAIRLQSFPVHTNLNATDLKAFRATFRNIRLWDGAIAEPAFQQLQGLRTYYKFDPMNIDRYTVKGEYRQVLIAPREIDYNALPAETWVNRHINFTHGRGVVIIPSSQIGPDGVPDFWMKNIGDQSPVGLRVTQPSIYYGRQTSLYALVDGRRPTFNYPSGSQDVYSMYHGSGGLPIGGLWNQLAFSLWANSYNPLLTNYVTPTTRAMLYRAIDQRLPEMLGTPFLHYGTHPYLVIANGKLYWMVNAYTESQNYPYATPARNGVNYLRNSVKVTVNAYNGTVRFYAADPHDPMLQTIEKIFPGVFRPLSSMPAALHRHLRYPEDLFQIQAQMYATYHMTSAQVFYNHEDQWRVARQIIGQQPSPVQPYYVIMQFPNIATPQFVLMEPFTPVGSSRDNMVSWLAAFSDGRRYGQLTAYEFPKRQTVFGPLQIEAQINQDPTVADILALWSRGGSKVYRGNMLTIPIRDSFLYVEPLYQEATATRLPALRRVIVDYNGQKIAVGDTLDQALVQLFGPLPWSSLNAGALGGVTTAHPGAGTGVPAGATGAATTGTVAAPTATTSVPGTAGAGATLRQAQALFQEAEAAIRQGDFATYGKRIAELGRLLGRSAPAGGAPSGGGTPRPAAQPATSAPTASG